MIHEMRQNFIHSEAKELVDKLGLDINTPEAFALVKTILDKYDSSNEKTETTSSCDLPTKEQVVAEGERQIIEWLSENTECEILHYRVAFRRSFEYVLRCLKRS